MRSYLRFPVLLVLLAAGACGSPAQRPAASAANSAAVLGPLTPTQVDDDEFAQQLITTLPQGEPSLKRNNLLAGLVQRQLARAQRRFALGHREAGLRALKGALYLNRAGELQDVMLEGGDMALQSAARAVSRIGKDGQAIAYYSMLERTLSPGVEQEEVTHHLKAIEDWAKPGPQVGKVARAGIKQRLETGRALLDARPEVLGGALNATMQWLDVAKSSNSLEGKITTPLSVTRHSKPTALCTPDRSRSSPCTCATEILPAR